MKKKLKKAIALKYDPSTDDAPQVTAKGAGVVAEKILKKAEKHGVKIHEDQSLLELLYPLEMEEQIPSRLYPIIAEVLAMIYQAEQIAGKQKND